MKKSLICVALATSAIVASAADIGLRYGLNGNQSTEAVGVTYGTQYKHIGLETSLDRTTFGNRQVDQYGVAVAYKVYTYKGVDLAAKVGGAFVQPRVGSDGYAGLVGLEATYPVSKDMRLVAEVQRQHGQDVIKFTNGNKAQVGFKFTF